MLDLVFFLTGVLQVQRNAPADGLGPQGHIPLFLLREGRKDKLGVGDEGLEPRRELVGASERA